MNTQHLIDQLGGPTKVAKMLGWNEPGAVQRVANWRTRGIPAQVLLDHGDVLRPPELSPKEHA
jgi:hypothetical protein